MKILIIDTRQLIRNRIESLLMRQGYGNCFFTTEYLEAQNLLKRIEFDLIICKIDAVKENIFLLLERTFRNVKTAVIYILDKGKEALFKNSNLPNAYTILIHPFKALNFRSAIEIYFKMLHEKRKKEVMIIQKKGELKKIKFKEILWVKSEGNYCYIQTLNADETIRMTMKKMLDLLPAGLFMQVHRSFIIQLEKIDNISIKDKVLMIEDNVLPIGRKYKNELLERLNIL